MITIARLIALPGTPEQVTIVVREIPPRGDVNGWYEVFILGGLLSDGAPIVNYSYVADALARARTEMLWTIDNR